MKKILSIILLLMVVLSSVSCVKNPNTPNETETNSVNTNSTEETVGENELNATNKDESMDNSSIQSEIVLNMDNYKTYLTFTSKTGQNDNGQQVKNYYHTVSGALRFAYYKNVVVTFCVKSKYSYDDNCKYSTYEVPLNAAGDVSFTCKDLNSDFGSYLYGSFEVTIENVSGEVIIPNMKV